MFFIKHPPHPGNFNDTKRKYKKASEVMDNTLTRQMQRVELDILIEVDRICKKHNIKYFLNAGTLLGAVRHKGFIPWDDDVDICMPLKDYRKFKKVCKKELSSKYFLQSFDTDLTSIWYTKIRKNGTTAIESGYSDKPFHQGIWVDVFPLIGVKQDPRWLKSIAKRAVFAKKLLTKKNNYIHEDKDLSALKKLHRIVPLWLVRLFAKAVYITTFKNPENYEFCYCLWAEKKFKAKYSSSLFSNSCEVEFEGHLFPAPENCDEYLTIEYGDYMTPPPPEKRNGGSHTIEIVDLKKDYTYYVNKSGSKI